MSFIGKALNLLIIIAVSSSAWAESPPELDGNGWYQKAQEAREARDFEQAHKALDAAAELEFSPIRINFERARQSIQERAADPAPIVFDQIEVRGGNTNMSRQFRLSQPFGQTSFPDT